MTDDITLKRDGNKLSLVPTKYSAKDVLFKSPRSVKAVLAGGDHAKGGFRLDKDRISWNDEHNFEDFSYIHITFKEALCKSMSIAHLTRSGNGTNMTGRYIRSQQV